MYARLEEAGNGLPVFRCGVRGVCATPTPRCMKAPRPVDPFERMRPEEVSLGLNQVRGKPFAAVGIVVSERCTHRRDRNSKLDGAPDGVAPAILSLCH